MHLCNATRQEKRTYDYILDRLLHNYVNGTVILDFEKAFSALFSRNWPGLARPLLEKNCTIPNLVAIG